MPRRSKMTEKQREKQREKKQKKRQEKRQKKQLEAAAVEELSKGLRSLPRELYDVIYDLTFTTEQDSVCYIDGNYKPPTILQVDHASRALAAQSFYNNSTFILQVNYAEYVTQALCFAFSGGKTRLEALKPSGRWLPRLAQKHRKLLRKVKIISTVHKMDFHSPDHTLANRLAQALCFKTFGLSPEISLIERKENRVEVVVSLNGAEAEAE